jgi:hypothetical protein
MSVRMLWGRTLAAISVMLVLTFIAPAHASPIVTTEMYRGSDPVAYTLWRSPTTWYQQFEVIQTRVLRTVAFFGQPLTDGELSLNDQIRWQLFRTTADWQTPNGNSDRLFYSTTMPLNMGSTDYRTAVFDDPIQSLCGPVSNEQGNCPTDLVLEQGSFYRLSLQVVGPTDWLMEWRPNADQQPTLTSDGFFRLYGYGDGTNGPLPLFTSSWTLQTELLDVSEPPTVALLGMALLSLFGFSLLYNRQAH